MSTTNEIEIQYIDIDELIVSPENDDIYHPIDRTRDDFNELVRSVSTLGIQEPLHVTSDHYILSGHRRHAAAKLIGLRDIPVVIHEMERSDMTVEDYRALLATFNTQRSKTSSERLREQLAKTKPKAHQQIIAEKLEQSQEIQGLEISTSGVIKRSAIGPNKQEFLAAVIQIVTDMKPYWPISSRRVHYQLLDVQPLTNSSKGKQRHRYANDQKSSGKLSDLLTRARVEGIIPMEAIEDETRTVTTWDVHDSVDQYVGKQVQRFASGYYRNLMAGQTTHIEVVVEKLTVKRMTEHVAMKYTIPTTVARGKCSLPPRHNVWKRWRASGKPTLTLILMADHDPDGVVVSDMWHQSLLGDFQMRPDQLVAIRSGINLEHAQRYSLPRSIEAKSSSSSYASFVRKYGTEAYELDALRPSQFQEVLTETIESVIDREAYDDQVRSEEKEAGMLVKLSEHLGENICHLMDCHGLR